MIKEKIMDEMSGMAIVSIILIASAVVMFMIAIIRNKNENKK
jgi:hypothetical protein